MARSLSQLFYAMGGSVSPGKSNDELIDHLIDAEFLRTPAIQRVFRSVDRGCYYHPGHKQNAYKDIAWKVGNLHLSAPCVYSVVMEALKLKPGLSFLNLGSGSGYLSTMAGLLLGQYGINHGIELHKEIVDYAYEKLDEFLKNSKVVDEHDFCEPVFSCGNCLTFDGSVQQYDRVYCGAACPEEYESYIKNLVRINGILIMPLNDKLLKITRIDETTWSTVKVLSVSFAPLIPPPTKRRDEIKPAKLGDLNPPTLQQLCRFKVREHLRKIIEAEHPQLVTNLKKRTAERSKMKLIIVNCGNEENADESDGGENLDHFTLMMRSLHRTSILLRGYTGLQSVNSDEEGSDSETLEDVLKFTALNTARDASDSFNVENGWEIGSPVDQDSSTTTLKSGSSETALKSGSTKEENELEMDSNHCDSLADLNNPPGMSTRSKTKVLKRKHSDMADGPSTSCGKTKSLSKKPLNSRSSSKKRVVSSRDAASSTQTFKGAVKLDSYNRVLEEFSHTYYLTRRIAALPLPLYLMDYLNYKRQNI